MTLKSENIKVSKTRLTHMNCGKYWKCQTNCLPNHRENTSIGCLKRTLCNTVRKASTLWSRIHGGVRSQSWVTVDKINPLLGFQPLMAVLPHSQPFSHFLPPVRVHFAYLWASRQRQCIECLTQCLWDSSIRGRLDLYVGASMSSLIPSTSQLILPARHKSHLAPT